MEAEFRKDKVIGLGLSEQAQAPIVVEDIISSEIVPLMSIEEG